MSHWRSFLLILCALLSGCAMRTESSAQKSPAPAWSGPSHTYADTSPRNTVPRVHQPGVGHPPVTRSHRVASLSPRLQGFYRTNPTIESVGAVASKQSGSLEESDSDDKIILAQPSGENPSGHVVAAGLFPVPEPDYAMPIAVVAVVAVLIYYGLYRLSGPGRPVAAPLAKGPPMENGNSFRDFKDEYLQYDKEGKRIERSDTKRERESVRTSERESYGD